MHGLGAVGRIAAMPMMSGLGRLGAAGDENFLAPDTGVAVTEPSLVLHVAGAAAGGAIIGGVSAMKWKGAAVGGLLSVGLVLLGDAASMANAGNTKNAVTTGLVGIMAAAGAAYLAQYKSRGHGGSY